MTTEDVLKTINDCAAECNRCFNACLNDNDITMMARCIELDRDCADICSMTASFLLRDSEKSDLLLKLCAEACEACADECDKHVHDHCRKCAEACRQCAETCTSLA